MRQVLALAQHPFAQLNGQTPQRGERAQDPGMRSWFNPHRTHQANRDRIDPALPRSIDQPTIEHHRCFQPHRGTSGLADLYRAHQNHQDVPDRSPSADQWRIRLEIEDRQQPQERRCQKLIDGGEPVRIPIVAVAEVRCLSHGATAAQEAWSVCANTRTCNATSTPPDDRRIVRA